MFQFILLIFAIACHSHFL